MSTLPARVRPAVAEIAAHPRSRPFGSKYSSQSPTYLLYLPFLLGMFGAAVWVFPTSVMFVLAALVGSLVGAYVLIDIVFRESPLRLTTIYGMTILLGYNLGSFNTWLTMKRGTLTLAESFARSPEVLGHAIGACMITAAVLFVIGELFERPIFGTEFYLTFGRDTLPIILSTTLLLAAAYASGKIGYMGIEIDENGHVNPATQLILWWFYPAYAYTVCAALNTKGAMRWAISGIALLQTVAMIPLGRRAFAYPLLLAMIASRLGRYRLRLPTYKKVLIGFGGLGLVFMASVAFLYLRVAGYELKGKGAISLVDRLGSAYGLVQKGSSDQILDMLGTNVAKRTFTIGFFSDLLNASQHSTPLLGKDLLYNIQLAVPSAISSDKFGIGSYGEEFLANMQWGFSYRDEANSLLTAGATDFGFLGVLAYPLLLTLGIRFALEWVQFSVPTNLAVIIALSYVLQSLQAEGSPVQYFLQVRSTILVVIVYYLLRRLPRFRLQSRA